MPESLWAADAGTLPSFDPLRGAQETEVAVIGAGFTGLIAALHLARAKIPVLVLEAEAPGWGASGRNGGQVIPGLTLAPEKLAARFGRTRATRYFHAAAAAPDELFDLIRTHAIDCNARQPGYLYLAHSPNAFRDMRKSAATLAAWGDPVRLLSQGEAQELTGSPAYYGGCLSERGGSVQPLRLVFGLAKAAERAGARITSSSPVVALIRAQDRWRLSTPEGAVTARKVLLCTNAYTDALERRIHRSLVRVNSFQAATKPLPAAERILQGGHAASDSRRLLNYFRTDREGRLVMGGRAPFKEHVTLDDAEPLRQAIAAIYPQLAETPLEYCWAGRIALTVDHLPRLATLAPNLHAAYGYNGQGVALSALFGRSLAELAAGTPPDALAVPVMPAKPIPLHELTGLGARIAIRWRGILDRFDDFKQHQGWARADLD